jgi:hypothetical protein
LQLHCHGCARSRAEFDRHADAHGTLSGSVACVSRAGALKVRAYNWASAARNYAAIEPGLTLRIVNTGRLHNILVAVAAKKGSKAEITRRNREVD